LLSEAGQYIGTTPTMQSSIPSSVSELGRGHHRQLRQTGNETAWWEHLQINALEIEKTLWEKTHRN